MRRIVATMLLSGQTFALPAHTVRALMQLATLSTLAVGFMEIVGHVQLLFALCDDKDAFLQMVCQIFGLFEALTFAQRPVIELACVNFIATLICDRAAFEHRKHAPLVNWILLRLQNRDCSVDGLGRLVQPMSFAEGPLWEQLKPALTVKDGRVSLGDASRWHIVQSWNFHDAMKCLETPSDALLPFPEWEEVDGVAMRECLRSRFLFALLYDILNRQLTRPSLALQYALNLFLLCAGQFSGPPASAPSVVVADSLEALALVLPADFQEFARTPVYYKLGVPCTVLQLIGKFGAVGARVLAAANFGCARTARPRPRPDAAAVKAAVVAAFAERAKRFEASIAPAPPPDSCAVCHRPAGERLSVHPALCFATVMPDHIEQLQEDERDELTPTRQLFCCPHVVHVDCLDAVRNSIFPCPVCGCKRSTALIAFSADLREFDSPAAIRRAEELWRGLLPLATAVTPGDVLADHIVVLEARAALRPEVLDADDVRALHRNLFLSAALLRVGRIGRRSGATPLARAIAAAIATVAADRTAALSFAEISAGVGDSTFSLYRRLALFGFFMAGIPIGGAVDWDALLDPAGLARIFRVRAPDPRYVPLRIVDLADDWVDLLAKPYNYDIVTMSEDTGVCLITGQRLMLVGFAGEGENVTVMEHVTRTLKGGPMLMLHLTGREATKVVFVSREFNVYLTAANAWVDALGMPDVGLRQGRLLSLNRTVLAEILDDLLSGRFYNGL
jgi:hypothetical protein